MDRNGKKMEIKNRYENHKSLQIFRISSKLNLQKMSNKAHSPTCFEVAGQCQEERPQYILGFS